MEIDTMEYGQMVKRVFPHSNIKRSLHQLGQLILIEKQENNEWMKAHGFDVVEPNWDDVEATLKSYFMFFKTRRKDNIPSPSLRTAKLSYWIFHNMIVEAECEDLARAL